MTLELSSFPDIEHQKESGKVNEIDEGKYKKGIQKAHNLEKRHNQDKEFKDPVLEIEKAENLDFKLKTGTLERSDIKDNMTPISMKEFLEGIKGTQVSELMGRKPEMVNQINNTEIIVLNSKTYYYFNRKTDNSDFIIDMEFGSIIHQSNIPKNERIDLLQLAADKINGDILDELRLKSK